MKKTLCFRFCVAAIACVISLFLVNCGTEDGSSSGTQVVTSAVTGPDYIPCRDDSECLDTPDFPACADVHNVTCFRPDANGTSDNACLYRIVDDANCPCIERDIRGCSLSPGHGFQHCLHPDPAQWRTEWGPCGTT
jgi:hypothetical protein